MVSGLTNRFRRPRPPDHGRAPAGAEPGAASPAGPREDLPPDLDPEFLPLYEVVRPFTMTSVERLYALWQATRHIVRAGIPGDVVECGVWRGGSMLLAARTLQREGDTSRALWLFDTFEGMTAPSERDVDLDGLDARRELAETDPATGAVWCYASEDDVRRTMSLAGDGDGDGDGDVRYVRGPVEETIPGEAPERIALLRLDTDWYASTHHELEHLYPRLAPGGVLIIDDYGHWQGARAAVDEYFAGRPVLLQRIDYTGRLAIKP